MSSRCLKCATRPDPTTGLCPRCYPPFTSRPMSSRRAGFEVSFSERYRGTEFEGPRMALAIQPPSTARGRTFVVMASLATICTYLAAIALVPHA